METQYPDDFVAGIEWMWGEGFLSPGGPDEVRALLEGVDLAGRRVLDVGCGLGGIDVLLIVEHKAGEVVGIDVEPQLVARAEKVIARAGVADHVQLQCVEPGPFPFPGEDFDAVFSKDSMIHIPDKQALYAEVLRVLRPGGVFVGSDWLYGGGVVRSEEMLAWLKIVHLDFELETPANTGAAMRAAGFVDVDVRDRNAWFREEMKRELATMTGDNYEALVAAVGEETAAHRVASSRARQVVVESGELRPCHLRGFKPA